MHPLADFRSCSKINSMSSSPPSKSPRDAIPFGKSKVGDEETFLTAIPSPGNAKVLHPLHDNPPCLSMLTDHTWCNLVLRMYLLGRKFTCFISTRRCQGIRPLVCVVCRWWKCSAGCFLVVCFCDQWIDVVCLLNQYYMYADEHDLLSLLSTQLDTRRSISGELRSRYEKLSFSSDQKILEPESAPPHPRKRPFLSVNLCFFFTSCS